MGDSSERPVLPQRVVITGVDISFADLLVLSFKLAIAGGLVTFAIWGTYLFFSAILPLLQT